MFSASISEIREPSETVGRVLIGSFLSKLFNIGVEKGDFSGRFFSRFFWPRKKQKKIIAQGPPSPRSPRRFRGPSATFALFLFLNEGP